ncbi:MAG TPA: four helix bundle protein [Acidobacteriaceae bacterium]|nr:four helix bundle protein [Acidobacteriaceae bacterium]
MKQQVSASRAGQRVSGKSTPRTRYFRDLLVWQKSMQLAKAVYQGTSGFPKSEVFGLSGQMRRAAVSVPSNIAEGHGRLSDGSMRVFLAQARGSLYELETQIELASGLGYLELEAEKELLESCREIGRMLNGLLAVLEG